MADLYERLADAYARPSRGFQDLEAALGAVQNVDAGFQAYKQRQEAEALRKMLGRPVRDYFGEEVPYGLAPQTSVREFQLLAPLAKDRITSNDVAAMMAAYNPESAGQFLRRPEPKRSPSLDLTGFNAPSPVREETPVEPPTGEPSIPTMSKTGFTMMGKALAQKAAAKAAAERQKYNQEQIAIRQKRLIDAANRRVSAKAKANYEKASATFKGTETQVEGLFKLYEEIRKEGKVGQAYGLRGRFYEAPRAALSRGNLPGTEKIYAFDQLANGLIARLRSFTGDVGVLTEQDAVRLRGLLPQIGEAESVSARKLDQIKKLLDVSKQGNLDQLDTLLREFGYKTQDAPWDIQRRAEQADQEKLLQMPLGGADDLDSVFSQAGVE